MLSANTGITIDNLTGGSPLSFFTRYWLEVELNGVVTSPSPEMRSNLIPVLKLVYLHIHWNQYFQGLNELTWWSEPASTKEPNLIRISLSRMSQGPNEQVFFTGKLWNSLPDSVFPSSIPILLLLMQELTRTFTLSSLSLVNSETLCLILFFHLPSLFCCY